VSTLTKVDNFLDNMVRFIKICFSLRYKAEGKVKLGWESISAGIKVQLSGRKNV